ncbi:PucR family transcriptional regulator [Nocardia stercoris]|uniref:PucR family transcriptional regulator n=1 Tax=Nocardia stercoris TaxID=2483361 RepID=A0A3M2KV38_9NOCA|nr:PucR family transcriptional regulator [Nocardia stercoris]RMI29497.1 PucR family transcriptional regulator [Nocardia stercoris]
MRLRSLTTLPELGLELVTGEAELDRFVRWVVTQDLVDPSRYLSGGELVLTGLAWHRDAADSETFVAALARARVAGLAAGDARLGAPPDDLVQACRRHRIPLFRVPEQVAFSTITERIMRALSAERASDVAALLDRHRQLVAGTGVGSVLDLVERDLGLRGWVVSATGRALAGPHPGPPPQVRTACLAEGRLPALSTVAGQPYSIFAVDEHGTSRAADWFLVFAGNFHDWATERRAMVGELAAIVSLERARGDDRQSAQGRLAEELIDLVVSDARPADIVARLNLTGIGSGPYVAIAAAAAEGLRPSEVRALVREILAGTAAATGVVDGETIALVPTGHPPLAVVQEALDVLAPALTGTRLSIGVSGAVDADGLRGAVEEARYARRMAAGRNQGASVVGQDELATHMLLLAGVPDEVRHMFRLRLLDPLTSYDADNGADLVHTLHTFLHANGSWTRSAELLHVHVNTLRYRIARIEELTGRDLSRLADRVDFFLALALR